MESQVKLFENYLIRRKSENTRRMYIMVVKKFIEYLDSIGLKLENISLSHVEAFLSTLDVKNRSLSLYSYALASFLNFIGKPELASLVPVTKYEVNEPRWITRRDVNTIISHIDNEIYKVMIETAFELALRVGEVVDIKWSDIDFENKTIVIKRLKKKKEERKIKPLSDDLVDKLRKLPRFSEYVFPSYGGASGGGWHKMTTQNAERIFRDAAKKAGFEDLTFHCLRHSRATEVSILTNGNIVEISKVTDHDDPRNVLVYVHIAFKHMRDLMGKKIK